MYINPHRHPHSWCVKSSLPVGGAEIENTYVFVYIPYVLSPVGNISLSGGEKKQQYSMIFIQLKKGASKDYLKTNKKLLRNRSNMIVSNKKNNSLYIRLL